MESNQAEQDKAQDRKEENVKKSFKQSYGSLRSYILHLLDIRNETDRDSTMEAILKDIPFRGHNAWILIFSIIVASVGLNVSSTAVVIGAMLISPLMGPIVGLGFSVAINDLDTLKRSLVNLAVMVVLSVFTAFVYFSVSPLTELTPELAARTSPTILDVLVAIFGGLALIIAKTKKGTIVSVIMGVAIATALMPPLCTAGYGLAVWDLSIFGGAMYLFCINTIFIALSTFLVSKILRFPLVRYANSLRRRRISQLATVIAILVMLPSVYLFYVLLKKSYFEKSAKTFVTEELMVYKDAYLQKNTTNIEYSEEGKSLIEVSFLGKEIPAEVINLWKAKMKTYENLKDTKLRILQNKNSDNFNEYKYIKELKTRDSLELIASRQQIQFLSKRLDSIRKSSRRANVPFKDIVKEIKLNYEKVTDVAFAEMFIARNDVLDTIPSFRLTWDDKITLADKNTFENRLANWLAYKIKAKKVDVKIEPTGLLREENQ
ncbi:DUF389 domain-containing protein [Mesohalobacter halotolerans]|uniref:DUF389 domain-containing protein n=1 Tax=Mesohalobacter halotolerans TaxID=1883405 RepID=A0A4U5TQD9_9FLAO|nr:DUF389 domain-containing protein [Mesohalobacter halotolerans]TKS56246.1 DUF389 domain-containing protein [Mesohalobacter halotolerans]